MFLVILSQQKLLTMNQQTLRLIKHNERDHFHIIFFNRTLLTDEKMQELELLH